MARFHTQAATGPGVDEFGSQENIARHWRGNFSEIAPFVETTLPRWELEIVERSIAATLERDAALFARRIAGGGSVMGTATSTLAASASPGGSW